MRKIEVRETVDLHLEGVSSYTLTVFVQASYANANDSTVFRSDLLPNRCACLNRLAYPIDAVIARRPVPLAAHM